MGIEGFGDQLRRLRLAAGMTQESLAERAGLSVRGVSDLERGLKQRPHPETVRMLAEALDLSPELLASFKAAATPRTPLAPAPIPQPLTPLIGREDDVRAIAALVHPASGTRLVTLTGPGGVGKTRLALQVASEVRARYADGAAFVALAGLAEPRLVLPALATALGIRDLSDRAPLDLLTRQLQERQVLAVVDNVEHLLAAAPDLATLLARCGGLTVLATSRAQLRLAGERVYPVRPLALPDPAGAIDPATVAEVPAVRLFTHQAQAVQPAFAITAANAPAVAAICARVDGLPLALELAAVRMKMLAPDDLAALLEHRLPVLTGGPRNQPTRQQTMRAAIGWSHDLLSARDQATFRRFAVFPTGATLDAVTAVLEPGDTVAALDRLTALLDQSLVQRQEGTDGQPRFVMLETIREYALARLAASDDDAPARDRHAAYFLEMAERGEQELTGPGQAAWMRRLEADYGNLRSALAWFVDRGDASASQRFGRAMWLFWATSGRLRDGREWLDRALALSPDEVSIDRARALVASANVFVDLADYPMARTRYEAGLAIYRSLGNQTRAAHVLQGLGLVQLSQGAYAEASASLATVLRLAREAGARADEARALSVIGRVREALGEFAEARRAYAEALAIHRELDNEAGVAWVALWFGRLAVLEGLPDDAWRWLQRSLDGSREVGDQLGKAYALCELGRLAHIAGDHMASLSRHLDALREAEEAGDLHCVVECLEGVAAVEIALGEAAQGVTLCSAAAAWRRRHGVPPTPSRRGELDRTLASARAALSHAAFTIAWDDGQRSDLYAAIDLAHSERSRHGEPAADDPATRAR